MIKTKFAYIIIGAGSAGFAAAIKANQLGINTALINGGLPLGGTCVNVGCVPSKTLLHIAQIYYQATTGSIPGLTFEKVTLNFRRAIEHELMLVERMRQLKYQRVLSSLSHVTSFTGLAKFIGPHEIMVNHQRLRGEKFLICAGASPSIPSIPGLNQVDYLTYVEALKLDRLPKQLVVIGGGPVALEFAQLFHHFGSQVTILQRSRLIKKAEPEISRGLVQSFQAEGIAVYENLQFIKVHQQRGQQVVTVKLASGHNQEFAGDQLLIGTGQQANTPGLGLETAGVETDRGKIKVSSTMQTTINHIWAAGDIIAAPKRLETTAAKEGNLATQNAWANTRKTITYQHIPSVIFTTPAVASVGLTEYAATEQGIASSYAAIPFNLVPKAQIIGDPRGIIKMVINRQTRQIIGVHLLARDAAELIHEATLAVKFGLTIDNLRDTVHVFPTLSEALKLVAQSFNQDLNQLSCCVE